MEILARDEQPWRCRREPPHQPHHQIHLLIFEPCSDDEAEAYATNYADQLRQPVYVHYWHAPGQWAQTYALVAPENDE